MIIYVNFWKKRGMIHKIIDQSNLDFIKRGLIILLNQEREGF